MSSQRRIVAFALFASLLVITAVPATVGAAGGGLEVASEHSSASELGTGSLTNAVIERSGEAGMVSHETYRSSAVARWAMDYGSGTTAYDHVNNNGGSISGATWVTGKQGQALDFDGSDDGVSTPVNATKYSNGFTISTWINADSATGFQEIVGSKGSSGNQLNLVYDSGKIRFYTFDSSSGTVAGVSNGYAVPTGSWVHVTAVYDPNKGYFLFVNGSLKKHVSTTTLHTNDGDLYIGQRPDGYHFDGTIDDTRVYSSSLTPGQALRLDKFPNVKLSAQAIHRWGIDAGQGTTVFGDEGVNGDLTNGTWVAGKSGQALSFDGDGLVNLSDNAHPPDKFTLTAWAKPESNNRQWIFAREHEVELGTSDHDGDGVPEVVFALDDGSGDGWILEKTSVEVPKGSYTHIGLRYNGSAVEIFRNGTAKATLSESGAIANDNNPAVIGSKYVPGSGYGGNWTGDIDEVRMFGSALSASSLSHLSNNPAAAIPESSSYQNSHSVTNSVKGYVELTLQNATANVTWKTKSGTVLNQTTISKSGNHTLSWSKSSADNVTVDVDLSTSDPDNIARVHKEGVLFDNHQPVLKNSTASPSGGSKLTTDDVTFSIDINDTEFSTAQGDNVTLDWYLDGAVVETTTVTSNGTASISVKDIDGGNHTWHVVATDKYGETTTSKTLEFKIPSRLALRNVSAPSTLVTGASVELTFFSSNDVITKNDSNDDGYIELNNLDPDEQFVVVARADGYYNRHVVVESLFQQSSIYLLPKNASAFEVRFKIDDPTGKFSSGDTIVYIQRPITRDFDGDGKNTTKYLTVAGDEAGVEGFTTYLEEGVRYRVKVKNENSSRIIGAYTASTSETVTLRPVPLSIQLNESQQFKWDAYEENVSGQWQLFIEYLDPANATTDLTISVWEQGNKSHQPSNWTNTTISGPVGSVQLSPALSKNESDLTWVVHFEGSRDGETIEGQVLVGPNVHDPTSIPDWMKQASAFIALILTGALFSRANYAVGGVTTAMLGGGFWFAGFLPAEAGGAVVVGVFGAVAWKFWGGGPA